MASAIQWIWSAPHNDYYYVTYDVYGQPQQYHFAKQLTATLDRQDSGPSDDVPPDPVPTDIRNRLRSFIAGTPEAGWTEGLDSTYKMRTGSDAARFFRVGKVFAMLHSEPAGGQSAFDEFDDAYSYVRFKEVVYSSIRRFVVVKVRQGFVYACAISTFSGRGTLKHGCIPSEYAVVYFTGTHPSGCYFEGERERGLTKEPIEVIPATTNPPLIMRPESRIRFSKQFAVEMNVKVKDIGSVHPEHLSKFLAYYHQYV